jgi:hypothetical protein
MSINWDTYVGLFTLLLGAFGSGIGWGYYRLMIKQFVEAAGA